MKCDWDGIIRDKDAERFTEALNNPASISREERERIQKNYEALSKIEVSTMKVSTMKSETSKKIQDETPQQRIEREAEGLSRIRVWPEQMRVTFKNGYIAGATAELQRYELERTETKELIRDLYNALDSAKSHLEYCGYGDAWERECAEEQKIPEFVEAVMERAKKFL
jgi:hypothetical protein